MFGAEEKGKRHRKKKQATTVCESPSRTLDKLLYDMLDALGLDRCHDEHAPDRLGPSDIVWFVHGLREKQVSLSNVLDNAGRPWGGLLSTRALPARLGLPD